MAISQIKMGQAFEAVAAFCVCETASREAIATALLIESGKAIDLLERIGISYRDPHLRAMFGYREPMYTLLTYYEIPIGRSDMPASIELELFEDIKPNGKTLSRSQDRRATSKSRGRLVFVR